MLLPESSFEDLYIRFCNHTGQLPALETWCEGRSVRLYQLWRLVHECHSAQPTLSVFPWNLIASSLLQCPAWRQDPAAQIESLYRTKLMDFDQSLMKQAAAYRALSHPAPRSQAAQPGTMPAAGATIGQSGHVQAVMPDASQLANGAKQGGSTGNQAVESQTGRGRPKRARSPSSEVVNQQQKAVKPVTGLTLPQAQPAIQQNWQQPQQQQSWSHIPQ